jgi:hypothetical protein
MYVSRTGYEQARVPEPAPADVAGFPMTSCMSMIAYVEYLSIFRITIS